MERCEIYLVSMVAVLSALGGVAFAIVAVVGTYRTPPAASSDSLDSGRDGGRARFVSSQGSADLLDAARLTPFPPPVSAYLPYRPDHLGGRDCSPRCVLRREYVTI